MERKQIETVAQPETLYADGFDDAIIGIISIAGKTRVVYDQERVIDTLCVRDGMSREVAEEFFEFNVAGAYMGEHTPVFVNPDDFTW